MGQSCAETWFRRRRSWAAPPSNGGPNYKQEAIGIAGSCFFSLCLPRALDSGTRRDRQPVACCTTSHGNGAVGILGQISTVAGFVQDSAAQQYNGWQEPQRSAPVDVGNVAVRDRSADAIRARNRGSACNWGGEDGGGRGAAAGHERDQLRVQMVFWTSFGLQRGGIWCARQPSYRGDLRARY